MSSTSANRGILVVVIAGTSFGMLFGSTVTLWLMKRRLFRGLERLLEVVEHLAQQVDELRRAIDAKPARKDGIVSSLDDDIDIFEDAYGGPVSWVGGLSSDQVSCISDLVDDQLITSKVDINSVFARIDNLLDGTNENKKEAYEELLKYKDQQENAADFLWRLSKATYFMSQFEAFQDKNKQKELVYQALEYASQALELDDCNPNVHKWYAITLGSSGDYESIATKIKNGYKFKEHIERTIQLNPKDPSGHYLLGRWCFGVYMLSWVERKMASTLFATPPSATVDEALENFIKADELNPGKWKENLLFIAKCYIQKRDFSNAVQWLDKANQVPIQNIDEVYFKVKNPKDLPAFVKLVIL